MKTKKLAFAALSVAAVTTCLCLSACANTADNGDGNTQTHTHTYAAEWSFDDTYHWHAATCGHDVVSDRAEHTYHGCNNTNKQRRAARIYARRPPTMMPFFI